MAKELTYYMEGHLKAGKFATEKQLKLNYDGQALVKLKRYSCNGWLVIGFRNINQNKRLDEISIIDSMIS